MKAHLHSTLILAIVCLPSAHAPAAEKAEVHFNRDIRPILSNRCFKCHGDDLKKAGLDLQTFETATKKLRGGEAAIVPGNAAKSELLNRVASEEKPMPPKSAPLTPEQIAKLKAWIEQGAKYEEHWAYVKPVEKPLPQLRIRLGRATPLTAGYWPGWKRKVWRRRRRRTRRRCCGASAST